MDPPSTRVRSVLRRLWLLWAEARFRIGRRLSPIRRLRLRYDQRRFGAVPQRRRSQYQLELARATGEAYRPMPYAGPITLVRSAGDVWAPADRGWGAVAKGGLEIYDMPGTHGEALQGESLEQAVATLSQLVKDARNALGEPSQERTPVND